MAGHGYDIEVCELKWGVDSVLKRDSGDCVSKIDCFEYDVVLGADVLYCPGHFDDLLATLEQICSRKVILMLRIHACLIVRICHRT